MNHLDKLLKDAKPVVPDLPESFTKRVMSEIASLEPVAQARKTVRWGRFFAGIGLLIVALLTFNNVIFEIQMNGSIELLYFGSRFLTEVIRHIPFDFIIPAIVVTAISAWLMWKSKVLKKSIATFVLGSYLFSTFGGAAIAATGINRTIQQSVNDDKKNWPFIHWLFCDRARFAINHPNFRMGKVIETNGQLAILKEPDGTVTKVKLPAGMTAREGQIISLTGESSDNLFKGSMGRHCDSMMAGRYFQDMPMMMRGKMRGGGMRMHHRMMMHHGEY